MNSAQKKLAQPEMLQQERSVLGAGEGRYQVRLASNTDDIRASQALRYKIFAEEMGAELASAAQALDVDELDPFCRHLLVYDQQQQLLVASTRILDDVGAEAFGRFYSESEFEMHAVKSLLGKKLEVGRTCVHADYRSGAVIGVLWQGLIELMYSGGYQWLFGCASIPWEQGGANVHAVMDRFRRKYMCDASQRVKPKVAVPEQVDGDALTALRIPPLLKAYVSLGAEICGEPSWDESFQVADVFVLLNVNKLSSRYVRHFTRNTTK